MSQIEATKKSDLITLPRSTTGLVQVLSTVPTVINLKAIGLDQLSNATASGSVPGLQDTFASIYADASDLGYIAGASIGDVTGSVSSVAVSAAGSGYTSAPAVSFTASTLVGSFAITAGGSGYSSPPVVSFSGGGGGGALAVAVIAGGQVTGINIACMGSGYVSGAPTVTMTGGGGSGATATAALATASATATISAGTITAITVSTSGLMGGAGYGSAGAAVVTISGGGGSGGAGTATVTLNQPSFAAVGAGNGNPGGAAGICPRLSSGQSRDSFARANQDAWLGVVASTSGGAIRLFRSSY